MVAVSLHVARTSAWGLCGILAAQPASWCPGDFVCSFLVAFCVFWRASACAPVFGAGVGRLACIVAGSSRPLAIVCVESSVCVCVGGHCGYVGSTCTVGRHRARGLSDGVAPGHGPANGSAALCWLVCVWPFSAISFVCSDRLASRSHRSAPLAPCASCPRQECAQLFVSCELSTSVLYIGVSIGAFESWRGFVWAVGSSSADSGGAARGVSEIARLGSRFGQGRTHR